MLFIVSKVEFDRATIFKKENPIVIFFNLYHTIPTCNDTEKYAFENILGKVENAGKEALKVGMGTSNRLSTLSNVRLSNNFNTRILRKKKIKIGHPKVSFYIPGSKWLYI